MLPFRFCVAFQGEGFKASHLKSSSVNFIFLALQATDRFENMGKWTIECSCHNVNLLMMGICNLNSEKFPSNFHFFNVPFVIPILQTPSSQQPAAYNTLKKKILTFADESFISIAHTLNLLRNNEDENYFLLLLFTLNFFLDAQENWGFLSIFFSGN